MKSRRSSLIPTSCSKPLTTWFSCGVSFARKSSISGPFWAAEGGRRHWKLTPLMDVTSGSKPLSYFYRLSERCLLVTSSSHSCLPNCFHTAYLLKSMASPHLQIPEWSFPGVVAARQFYACLSQDKGEWAIEGCWNSQAPLFKAQLV